MTRVVKEPIVFMGNHFDTLKEVADLTTIPYSILYNERKRFPDLSLDEVALRLNPFFFSRESVSYKGRKFVNMHQLCITLKISSYALHQLLKKDKSNDKWQFRIQQLIVGCEMENQITTRFGTFSSTYDFCDKHLLDKGYMTFLLTRGITFDSACVLCDKLKLSDLLVNGVACKSLEEYCKVTKQDYFSVMVDLSEGKSLSTGFKKLKPTNKISAVYKGHDYGKVSLLVKHFGIDSSLLRQLLTDGKTLDVAVDDCIKSKEEIANSKYRIRNRTYKNLELMAKDLGVSYQTLSNAINSSISVDEGIKLIAKRKSRHKLFYEDVDNSRYAKVFNITESSTIQELAKGGSVKGAVELRMQRPSSKSYLIHNYKGKDTSLENIATDLNISAPYLFFLIHELGSFDLAVKKAQSVKSRGRLEVVAFGIKYASFRELVIYFTRTKNYNVTNYHRKSYNSYEEFIANLMAHENKVKKKLIFNGDEYPSTAEFCRIKGIPEKTFRFYLSKEGMTVEQAYEKTLELPDKNIKQVKKDVLALNVYKDGVYLGTASEVLVKSGVSYKVFYSRYVDLGWDLYEACTVVVSNYNAYSGVYKGIEYESLKDLANKLKVSYSKLYKNSSLFSTLEEAVSATLRSSRGSSIATSSGVSSFKTTNRRNSMRNKIQYQDRPFNSEKDIARSEGVSYRNLKILREQGLSLEDAMQKLVALKQSQDRVVYKDTEYASVHELGERLGWKEETIKDMLRAGQKPQSIVDTLSVAKYTDYVVYNKVYATLAEVANYYKLDESELQSRLDVGYSPQLAVELNRITRYMPVTIEGKTFSTIKKAAKVLGVSHLMLHRELARGRKIDALVKFFRKKLYEKGKTLPFDDVRGLSHSYIVYAGVKYDSVVDFATFLGIEEGKVKSLINEAIESNHSLDELLKDKILY